MKAANFVLHLIRSSRMRRFLDGLYLISGAIGAACVALIAILMVSQSILRELNVRTGVVNDLVSWLCAAAAFFAMAHAFKHGDFVRVTLVLEKLSARQRRVLDIVSLLIGSIATSYLAYSACAFTYESFEFNDMAQGLLVIPMWIPQSTFAFGAVLLCVALIDELIIVLRGGVPSYVRAVEERHARGDFSSDI
jgi:TRAP-type C4-dicarboxylate transport system permease small subunit